MSTDAAPRALRSYPEFDKSLPAPTRPISFVCVRFCDDFLHNLATSPAVHDPMNQLIVIDNTANLSFDTLSAAMCAGLKQARHDLVAFVHEDVVLRPGWQARFQASLTALEQHDPDWACLGAVGWRPGIAGAQGHWSDPGQARPRNHFASAQPFFEVERLDEQLLVIDRRRGILPDPALPSIHNIGRDMVWAGQARGLVSYALDAATIHKYAGPDGALIQTRQDSPKIRDRRTRRYQADKDCSDSYLAWKYGDPPHSTDPRSALDAAQNAHLDRPVILLGRGGGGTRLVSLAAQDCGAFLGSDLNKSGDSLEMVGAVYRSVHRTFRYRDAWSRGVIVRDLASAATHMLQAAGWPALWGFKLPECALILPHLANAFPRALYVHLDRDPRSTILRRPHMSALTDNQIGRTCLRAAYAASGRPPALAASDSDLVRMAITTRHQLGLIETFQPTVPEARWHRIGFEDLISDPARAVAGLGAFLDAPPTGGSLRQAVEPARAAAPDTAFDPADVAAALAFLNQPAGQSS